MKNYNFLIRSYLFFRLFFFLFFFILNFVYADISNNEINDNILYANNIFIDLSLKNNFYLTSQANNIKVYFEFFPENSFNQYVSSIETEPYAEKLNYAYLFNYERLVRGNYKQNLNTKLINSFKFNNISEKIDFPFDKNKLPKDVLIYLEPTKKIDVNDMIKNKANEIAQGDDDLFSVVFKLAYWVYKNIDYNINTKTEFASQPASWVLENKYGVCDELTNLFISMCRSLGIPARFVSGISYTNSDLFQEKWGLHGWAEVYFPNYGWVSFDPTYAEFGYLDPGHIKLKDSLDSDKSSVKYEWSSKNSDIYPGNFSFKVNNIKLENKIKNPVDMNLRLYYNDVGFGSYNLVELELINKLDNYLAINLFILKPIEIKLVDEPNLNYFLKSERNYDLKNSNVFVLLRPNEVKKIYWIIKVDDSLSNKYSYGFPIQVINSFNYSSLAYFTSSSTSKVYNYEPLSHIKINNELEKQAYKKDLLVSCDYSYYSYINEKLDIVCNFENKGNLFFKKLRACIKNCQYFDLGINENKNITFNLIPNNFGQNNFTLILSNKDISLTKKYSYYSEDKPKLTIENIKIPENISYEDFEISFEIWKHSISKPKNVTILIKFNDFEKKIFYDEIRGNEKINLLISKNLLRKNNNQIIKMYYYDLLGNEIIEVYENINFNANFGLLDRLNIFINSLIEIFKKI